METTIARVKWRISELKERVGYRELVRDGGSWLIKGEDPEAFTIEEMGLPTAMLVGEDWLVTLAPQGVIERYLDLKARTATIQKELDELKPSFELAVFEAHDFQKNKHAVIEGHTVTQKSLPKRWRYPEGISQQERDLKAAKKQWQKDNPDSWESAGYTYSIAKN